jgi:hypothetical protein
MVEFEGEVLLAMVMICGYKKGIEGVLHTFFVYLYYKNGVIYLK